MMDDRVLLIPLDFISERHYIADVVFREFLGLHVQVVEEDRADWCLTDVEGNRRLIMPDSFFNRASQAWLLPGSLPTPPLPVWQAGDDLPEAILVNPQLPVIAGEPSPGGKWFTITEDCTACLGVDVPGAAFFMLTRYEELVVPERDEHGRFPAFASLASRAGFLERPIIDEYVEVMWAAMRRLWPGLERKETTFEFRLSHDVDNPFSHRGFCRLGSFRAAAGDVLKRQVPLIGLRRAVSAVMPGGLREAMDPHNTFDWLMDLSERHGLRSAFYFISGGGTRYDPVYALSEPRVRRLLRGIHERGHEIGLHGSYDTMDNAGMLAQQYRNLLAVCADLGVRQEAYGGRQHYLRWTVPDTWRIWADAGLAYDTSVGFAQVAGFRCGTAREYPVFDLRVGQPLPLRERPLIVMDCSLLSDKYAGLSPDKAIALVQRLVQATRRVRGTFTLLWHNSYLYHPSLRRVYRECLECCR